MTGNLETAETAETARGPVGPPSTVRLVGLDLARGLAVFGMFTAHLAPDPAFGGASAFFAELTRGRSSALFAVLAGITLAYLAGRPTPKVGGERVRALVRIAIRAGVLIVAGTLLTRMGTPIAVILPYYGLCLLLALPLTRLPARTLVPIAAGSALVGPQLLYLLRGLTYEETGGLAGWARAVYAHDPASRLGGDGVVDLLITGNYPVPAWLPFFLVGMALGRLDLTAAAVRARLLVVGPALALLGYGGSWLALQLFPYVVWISGAPSAWWSEAEITVVTDDPAWLLVGAPHTETTFATLGNAGVAISVIAAALTALDRWPAAHRAAAPLIAVGGMSLSAYVGHLLAIEFLGMEQLDRRLPVLAGFVVVTAAVALLWRRFLGRGPLEHLMHAMTRQRAARGR
ncbi:heparan-alpha-glucosaminide N-acetyltransferase domain-containing protein [Streptomyces mayteni]